MSPNYQVGELLSYQQAVQIHALLTQGMTCHQKVKTPKRQEANGRVTGLLDFLNGRL